ncbi:MAG: PEGA domain-containing protein [Ignavibacteriota bacterium]
MSIPIEILQGAAPVLTGAIDAKNGRCFLVAGFGPDVRVYGSGTGFRANLDGKPVGALAPAGLPLQGLAPGTHELVIDSDLGTHDRMVFESQPSATLYVTLGTAQNLGTLSVETNEDQVHLLINGQKYRRDTARGRLVLYLLPRKYTVTVQKDGFAPAAEQTVEVKKGQDTKVSFTLSAAKSVLAVHHAPPGTDVLVDNISRGTTHADGEFQVGAIEPGRHTVTLRHDGFRPMQSEQTFTAGKTLDLQAALESAPTTGTLRFEISPAGLETHVRVRRDGESQERDVTGATVSLPEGHYVVSVSAPQYAPTSTAVQVTAGGTAVASVTLRHMEPKAPAKFSDWKTG